MKQLSSLSEKLQQTAPPELVELFRTVESTGYEAYLVGGCVRDLCLGLEPKDWDLATNARPGQIQSLFPRVVPTGIKHGTVTVLIGDRSFEITTYRVETGYSDHRHPDRVTFASTIYDDLSRRDFTFNAMALDLSGRLVDPFGGAEDLKGRLVRAVGNPRERFEEDALRMLRAVRFAVQLDAEIEEETWEALCASSSLLQHVSRERIRDEFSHLLVEGTPSRGLEMLRLSGLLEQFIPELLEGVGFQQNEHHRYTVWEHNLEAVDNIQPDLVLRLTALLHDIAKPATATTDEEGRRHFFQHEVVGAQMARDILKRLRYDNATTDRVVHLIRHHMALHLYRDMTDSAVRRLISRVGLENIRDLLELRKADRAASGTKKGSISRGTSILLQRIEKVIAEDNAFGLKDLAVNGHDVMDALNLRPGPVIGKILNYLLEQVLEDPELNEREKLLELARKWYRQAGQD